MCIITCTNKKAILGICRTQHRCSRALSYLPWNELFQARVKAQDSDMWCWWCTCPGLGISVHHQVWDLLCQGCPKTTQPPDGRAGPRGSLRPWTSPPEPVPLSFPLSSPPRQAVEVVCCRRCAETCRAVGCLDKDSNALLQIHKPGIKEVQTHLFPLPWLSLPAKSTEPNPD